MPWHHWPVGLRQSELGRIIAGISAPTVGRVMLDSIDVSVLGITRRRHLGYLPQDINLIRER
jgi:ATP-binding cassette subfamily C protein